MKWIIYKDNPPTIAMRDGDEILIWTKTDEELDGTPEIVQWDKSGGHFKTYDHRIFKEREIKCWAPINTPPKKWLA